MRVATQVQDVGDLATNTLQVPTTMVQKTPLSVIFSGDATLCRILTDMERKGITEEPLYLAMRDLSDRNYDGAMEKLKAFKLRDGHLGAIAGYYLDIAQLGSLLSKGIKNYKGDGKTNQSPDTISMALAHMYFSIVVGSADKGSSHFREAQQYLEKMPVQLSQYGPSGN
ncbi:hypothetical protein HYX02_08175 [Candidatus Woesearchaeota archaeon]|nr:hypothetical protein [Candidatus Woesearchaeota archaeon]